MSGQGGAATDLGDRLRNCRRSAGMSQARLAECLGTTRDRVSAHEHGRAADEDTVLAIAWATGCGDQAEELKELARLALAPVHVEPDQPLVTPSAPGTVKPARRWPMGLSGLPVVVVDELA